MWMQCPLMQILVLVFVPFGTIQISVFSTILMVSPWVAIQKGLGGFGLNYDIIHVILNVIMHEVVDDCYHYPSVGCLGILKIKSSYLT